MLRGTLLAVLLLWEAFARSGLVDPLFISSPTRVAQAGFGLLQDGDFWNDLRVSGTEFLFGYGLAVAIAIPLGLAIGLSRRLRPAFETLGPTYIKLGQILSSGEGVFPEELVAEFRLLRDRVPPEPFSHVRRTIEEDLGRPLAEVFTSFDRAPIASASIAQVHSATLRTGERVVVKVQRRAVGALVRQDIAERHANFRRRGAQFDRPLELYHGFGAFSAAAVAVLPENRKKSAPRWRWDGNTGLTAFK